MTIWREGMAAACIAASCYWIDENSRIHQGPKKGRVFTVTATRIVHGRRYLAFIELGAGEFYDASQFRPVQPKTTDISIFQRMCWDAEQRERI